MTRPGWPVAAPSSRDGERRSIRRQDGFRRSLPCEFGKDLFLDLHLFRGGFDRNSDVAHFDMLSRSDDARATLLRLFRGHQPTLDRVAVGLLDVGEAAVELLGTDIAQDHRDTARAEPLRDPGAHDARADDRGVRDLLGRRFRGAFAELVAQEKIANQVPRRFGFTELDDRIQLHPRAILRSNLRRLW